MSKRSKFWPLNLLYISLCIAGMSWQVVQLSLDFFSYHTDTRIRIKYPSQFYFPAVTVCIRYNDILDYKRAKSRGHKWTTSLNYSDVQRVQREITIREIFDLTPNGSDIIETFYHRSRKGYSYTQNDNLKSIRAVLDVKKFIYIEYICYRIQMKVPLKSKTTVVSVHPIASGTLGQMTMGRVFRKVTQYKVSLHNRQALPYESLMVQPIIRRNGKDLKSLNTVFALPGNFSINYLKAPYVTDCFDYSGTQFYDRAHCVQSCVLKNTFKQFKKYPYSVFVENSSDHQLVNYQDAADAERSEKLERIISGCEMSKACRRKTCHSTTTITFVNLVDATDEDFSIVIAVPQSPWTYIDHFPSVNLTTYIVYTMGAFGTWTGLSVISLNPFSLFLKRKENGKEARNSENNSRPIISIGSGRNRGERNQVGQPRSIQPSYPPRSTWSLTR